MDNQTLEQMLDPFGLESYDDRLTWAELHLDDTVPATQAFAAVIVLFDGEFEESDVRPARAASLLAATGEAFTAQYAQIAHEAGVSWASIGRQLWKAAAGGPKEGLSPQAVQQRCKRYVELRAQGRARP